MAVTLRGNIRSLSRSVTHDQFCRVGVSRAVSRGTSHEKINLGIIADAGLRHSGWSRCRKPLKHEHTPKSWLTEPISTVGPADPHPSLSNEGAHPTACTSLCILPEFHVSRDSAGSATDNLWAPCICWRRCAVATTSLLVFLTIKWAQKLRMLSLSSQLSTAGGVALVPHGLDAELSAAALQTRCR